ncbi:MAG: hypothetical protein ACRDFS_03965 [Chloroflexota bacterium]
MIHTLIQKNAAQQQIEMRQSAARERLAHPLVERPMPAVIYPARPHRVLRIVRPEH